MKKGLFALVTLICVSISTTGHTNVSEIDLRSTTEAQTYFVTFSARGECLNGHAFVAYGVENFDNRITYLRAWGLYTENRNKRVSGGIPSKFVDESTEGALSKISDNLIVKVNKTIFEKADEIRSGWAEKEGYQLIEKDCVSFLSDVAKGIGLLVPERSFSTEKPQDYVKSLIEMNIQKPEAPKNLRIVAD